MAAKKTPVDRFRERLDGLSAAIADDLRLPSLEENRLEGYAYLFRLVLPLLSAKGKRVFTDPILDELFQVLDNRFGGCMVASSSSAPPLWGLWHPPQESQAEKDYRLKKSNHAKLNKNSARSLSRTSVRFNNRMGNVLFGWVATQRSARCLSPSAVTKAISQLVRALYW